MPKLSRQMRRALAREVGKLVPAQPAAFSAPLPSLRAQARPDAEALAKAPTTTGPRRLRASSEVDTEPTSQMRRVWDPARVRSAEVYADWGALELAAELCDAMLADSDIASALGKRVRQVYQAKLSFSPGKGRRKKRAAKAIEGEQDWWTMVPEAEFAQWATWGLLLGVSLAQLVPYKDEETGRLLPCLKFWHPRTLRYDLLKRTWIVRTENRGEVDLSDPAEAGKWLLLMPNGSNRPWASGLWRGLAVWYLLTAYAVIDWGESSGTDNVKVIREEVTAHTGPIGGDSGAAARTSKLRRSLAEMVSAMGAKGTIALPPGFDLDLLSQPANTHQKYVDQITVAAKQKDVMILGSDMATRGENSNRSGGQTGENVLSLYASSDAEVYATVLYELTKFWAQINFGDPRAALWPDWQTKPPEQIKVRAEGYSAMAKSLEDLRKVGLRPDARALAEEYEIPLLPKRAGEEETPEALDAKFYEYHFGYGIATVDEHRGKLGLPLWGGEKGAAIPTPVAAPASPEVGGEGGAGGVPGKGPGGKGEPSDAGKGGEGGGPGPASGGGKAGSGGGGKADPAKPSQGAPKSSLGRPVALASVEGPAIEGLAYVDAVTDAAIRLAPKVLASVLDSVLGALEVDDYEACRKRLLELAGDEPPPALHQLLGRLAAMSAAAGAYSGSVEDPVPAGGNSDLN
jgi:Protein of unknown function (DUF935)